MDSVYKNISLQLILAISRALENWMKAIMPPLKKSCVRLDGTRRGNPPRCCCGKTNPLLYRK